MRYIVAVVGLLHVAMPWFARATPAPVRITGNTTAGDELLHDTLVNLTQFAPSFGCDRIAGVDTYVLPQSLVSARASFRVKGKRVTYERWKVAVCGKIERFMIIYVLEPQGGTNIVIKFPYPRDAP